MVSVVHHVPYLNMARERGQKYTHLKTHAGAINSRQNFRNRLP